MDNFELMEEDETVVYQPNWVLNVEYSARLDVQLRRVLERG